MIQARDNFLTELKSIKCLITDKTQGSTKKKHVKLMPAPPHFNFRERQRVYRAESFGYQSTNFFKFRRIAIRLDIKGFYSKFAKLGFYSLKRNSPLSVLKLTFLQNYEIVSFYSTLIWDCLNWFRCVDNFTSVRKIA